MVSGGSRRLGSSNPAFKPLAFLRLLGTNWNQRFLPCSIRLPVPSMTVNLCAPSGGA